MNETDKYNSNLSHDLEGGGGDVSTPSRHAHADGPKSLLVLFRAMRLSLLVYVLFSLVVLATYALYMLFPAQVPDSFVQFYNVDLRMIVWLELPYILVGLTSFFFVARFMYLSMRNLHTVNAPSVSISPFWAVGWFFIPVANLFMPAKAMSQIYHGTHDAVDEPSRHKSPIPYWWAPQVLILIPAVVVGDNALAPSRAYLLMSMTVGVSMFAALIFLWMGRRIAERQERLRHGGVAAVFD